MLYGFLDPTFAGVGWNTGESSSCRVLAAGRMTLRHGLKGAGSLSPFLGCKPQIRAQARLPLVTARWEISQEPWGSEVACSRSVVFFPPKS
ncbi:hypothetical protein MPNT_80016 [Candidatus Methylacidithermus pantelleriae]|uniref:Uncharacterized protein n=1 Tax=Candidatus Methylacidithermus pantelleriae TaxID=2744239 RepID=A0A8J2BM31_9BACT|nr:hypothetical protein MPNT_80016 [Candidatus Methylacidithermus pantelleriae]